MPDQFILGFTPGYVVMMYEYCFTKFPNAETYNGLIQYMTNDMNKFPNDHVIIVTTFIGPVYRYY